MPDEKTKTCESCLREFTEEHLVCYSHNTNLDVICNLCWNSMSAFERIAMTKLVQIRDVLGKIYRRS